jgi:hypothetical protein
MALTAEGYKSRIRLELNLLGEFGSIDTELIRDALTQFCRYVEPEIAASLVVADGATVAEVPDTIEKITDLRDSDGARVTYALDVQRRKLQLTAGGYTVYGTPRNVRTNYDTIIAGLNENYGDVLWTFIEWRIHKQSESDRASERWSEAVELTRRLKQDRNRQPDSYRRALQLQDVRGNIINDAYNADGIEPNITSSYEMDLL